jgi:quercetin dioxygenase-like cupin family protein
MEGPEAMHIVMVDASRARPREGARNFSGSVRFQRLYEPAGVDGLDLIAVFFEPGARTRPHVHSADQMLHVVEGEGIVATDRERRLIRGGDIVIIPAGQWHWHGATPTSTMCHISARSGGSTDWSVPLRDWEMYAEGTRG